MDALKHAAFGDTKEDDHKKKHTPKKKKRIRTKVMLKKKKAPTKKMSKSHVDYRAMKLKKKDHMRLYKMALRGKSRTSTLKFNPYNVYSVSI